MYSVVIMFYSFNILCFDYVNHVDIIYISNSLYYYSYEYEYVQYLCTCDPVTLGVTHEQHNTPHTPSRHHFSPTPWQQY
jgi:hypothetical protein